MSAQTAADLAIAAAGSGVGGSVDGGGGGGGRGGGDAPVQEGRSQSYGNNTNDTDANHNHHTDEDEDTTAVNGHTTTPLGGRSTDGIAIVLERLQRCRATGAIMDDDSDDAVGRIERLLADTLWHIESLQLQRERHESMLRSAVELSSVLSDDVAFANQLHRRLLASLAVADPATAASNPSSYSTAYHPRRPRPSRSLRASQPLPTLAPPRICGGLVSLQRCRPSWGLCCRWTRLRCSWACSATPTASAAQRSSPERHSLSTATSLVQPTHTGKQVILVSTKYFSLKI